MVTDLLIQAALTAGAAGAAFVSGKDIVYSETFREICRANQCGKYGKCWTCPPDVGDIDALIASLGEYKTCLLYQSISTLEDSYDFEGMQAAGTRHAQLSRALGKKLSPYLGEKTLHLGAGGCRFCPRCAKLDDLPCRAPKEALSSLEAYGINVYQTVKKTALKYINGQNTVTYFGAILF